VLYIEQLKEIGPPPNQNTIEVCNQITFLILYYTSSRPITLLKVIEAPIQVYDIFDLTASFKLINFSFRIFLRLSLTCLLASRLTLFRLSTWVRFGSCNLYILVCFLWSKKRKHFQSSHDLCCFNSYRSRLCLDGILNFLLCSSKPYVCRWYHLKLSEAANVFQILIRYCFLTPSSFSFLNLNLSTLNFYPVCLLTANISLTFATTR